jgi:hypothetical protein
MAQPNIWKVVGKFGRAVMDEEERRGFGMVKFVVVQKMCRSCARPKIMAFVEDVKMVRENLEN